MSLKDYTSMHELPVNYSDNSSNSVNDANYFPFLRVVFGIFSALTFYYESLFFPLGITFNILLLMAFSASEMGTAKTTRVYYLAMAYGELGTVFAKDCWFFWASIGIPYITGGFNPLGALNGMSPTAISWLCGLKAFIWYSHETFANYIFLLFELERVMEIYAPLKARKIFTMRCTIAMVRNLNTLLVYLSILKYM